MPGRDGSGPMGTGQNGRGLGPCGTGQRGFFGGWGAHRGLRGMGRFCNLSVNAESEEELLNQQKSWIEERLETLKKTKE